MTVASQPLHLISTTNWHLYNEHQQPDYRVRQKLIVLRVPDKEAMVGDIKYAEFWAQGFYFEELYWINNIGWCQVTGNGEYLEAVGELSLKHFPVVAWFDASPDDVAGALGLHVQSSG